MPKVTDEALEPVLVKLFKSDLAELRTLYAGSFGVNRAVRTIVRSYLTQVKARANKAIDEAEAELDININDLVE